jgi:hypothetical protein
VWIYLSTHFRFRQSSRFVPISPVGVEFETDDIILRMRFILATVFFGEATNIAFSAHDVNDELYFVERPTMKLSGVTHLEHNHERCRISAVTRTGDSIISSVHSCGQTLLGHGPSMLNLD